MFAHRHKTSSTLSTAAKARLNTQSHITHKLETNSESSRKHSPEAHPGTQLSSSSDVMVFTNTHHGNGGGRQAHTNPRSLPEYPQIDEIQNFFDRFWDQKMREINDPNSKLSYKHLGKPNERNYRKETSPSVSSPSSSNSSSAVSSRSPQHNVKRF